MVETLIVLALVFFVLMMVGGVVLGIVLIKEFKKRPNEEERYRNRMINAELWRMTRR